MHGVLGSCFDGRLRRTRLARDATSELTAPFHKECWISYTAFFTLSSAAVIVAVLIVAFVIWRYRKLD